MKKEGLGFHLVKAVLLDVKLYRRVKLVFISILLVTPFLSMEASAEANVREIDIMKTPEMVLFDLTNLKPGDSATRKLLVKNNGTEDFDYLFSSKLKSGSEKFYNELDIIVSDQKGELFNGKLKDLKKFEPRFLSNSSQEELIFKVDVPTYLGNEYQGLSSMVEFKFYVEGSMGGLLPVDGPKLPDTATSMFNFIVLGLALVTGGFLLFLYARRRVDSRF